MKLIYLDTAKRDLVWYRTYYKSVFPAGARRAMVQYLRAIGNLADNPYLGHPVAKGDAREYSNPRMPFSIIYRVIEGRIEIMHLGPARLPREARI